MKGIILAGGTGSRLYPLTKVTNKHLLPVGDKPMIYHPIEKLLEVGIKEVLIVTGTEHMGDVVNLLGSGKDFNCRFTYKVQDEAGGIAQALGLAENFAGIDPVVVILGDNIFEHSLQKAVSNYDGSGAQILIQKVEDPERYGVAELEGDKVISIEEKPKEPKSNYAVTGIYFYDTKVFECIRTLKPSGRGELEITDVNNFYIKNGLMKSSVLEGWWTDAGTPDSYKHANKLVQD
ncbi:MAG: spore coat protein [Bacteroidetes bacterium]|jgi:glucose-1-phosphate thymidylyltransferase|nr:spore coat protein [Bacteroidota bacterium]MAC06710.1 spore coat protein [Balneola sp.]MAO76906.1 spore coat protein [Balneola sp.]MBF64473.1 spore coat protein [Balneola sp.]MBF65725.1 spore coat protein [Balneola sp.]|tara:strand:+ start:16542 stop:17243 length:702 start_codon:yes stop_codon:yes gene_type:complete